MINDFFCKNRKFAGPFFVCMKVQVDNVHQKNFPLHTELNVENNYNNNFVFKKILSKKNVDFNLIEVTVVSGKYKTKFTRKNENFLLQLTIH